MSLASKPFPRPLALFVAGGSLPDTIGGEMTSGPTNGDSNSSADSTSDSQGTDRTDRWTRISRVVLRVAAVATGGTVPLLAERLDEISDPTALVSAVSLWVMWAVVLLAVLVPAATSLTAVRLVAPAHLVVTGILVIGHLVDDPSPLVVLAVLPTLVVNVVAFGAETGAWFVQASAYGDERRVPLRPPPAFVVVQVAAWIIWVSSLVVGVAALVRDAWWAGGALVAVGVILTIVLPPRFHRLSRRWFVIVPAGLVLHDHVVLAETAMFGRASIASIDPTRRSNDDADLSGRCGGTGLAIELLDFETVVLAATSNRPGGSALHVKSLWIRPSRPGHALSAWNEGSSTSRSK